MKKNILPIAILLIAVAIVVINMWKPVTTGGKKKNSEEVVTAKNPASKTNATNNQEADFAPDFELTTLSGKQAKLSDFKGKKVILNFWATWCPPCRAEMPHMQSFYEKNKSKGIEVVAINLTSNEKSLQKVQKVKDFVKEYKLTFPILLDEVGMIGAQYQVFTIPTSYILDEEGKILKKQIGPMDEEMMEKLTAD
ncbi:peroxiredoxin family protein [Heyndrickxia sp. NPDC080065]|uniref:peroxiredoxin family protein n=1 Tax=Heyndrickxia sp. NPDC080065 TaxID=3390568 RepID=UPI003D089EAA